MEFVHKSTDQVYPTAGNPQQVFGRARIGNFADVETVALVANANLKPVFVNFEPQPHTLARVVLISMPDGIDHRFVHGHFDLVLGLLAKSCCSGDSSHDLFNHLKILEIALKSHFHNAGFSSHKPRPELVLPSLIITLGGKESQ